MHLVARISFSSRPREKASNRSRSHLDAPDGEQRVQVYDAYTENVGPRISLLNRTRGNASKRSSLHWDAPDGGWRVQVEGNLRLFVMSFVQQLS